MEISLNLTFLEEMLKKLEELEAVSVIQVPEPSGEGAMYEEMRLIVSNMKGLSEDTQKLIHATKRMINDVYIPFKEMESLRGYGR